MLKHRYSLIRENYGKPLRVPALSRPGGKSLRRPRRAVLQKKEGESGRRPAYQKSRWRCADGASGWFTDHIAALAFLTPFLLFVFGYNRNFWDPARFCVGEAFMFLGITAGLVGVVLLIRWLGRLIEERD